MTTAIAKPGWRIVHNNVQVIQLSGANTNLTTIHTVFEAATKAACMEEITRLALVLPTDLDMDGPIDPPTPAELAAAAQRAKDEADATAAKTYTKLTALKAMSPVQVQAWVAANVKTLAQAQDAIATLAIAVSILARRL